MAKHFPYFRNFESLQEREEVFSEGPFVVVNANGYRIECECGGCEFPILPTVGIYDLIRINGMNPCKTNNVAYAEVVCNWLNAKVSKGLIVKNYYGEWIPTDVDATPNL